MSVFFFNDTATTEIYTLSLHDALPIYQHRREEQRQPGGDLVAQDVEPVHPEAHRQNCCGAKARGRRRSPRSSASSGSPRSEEHTSELQSRQYLVCRLLLEKKNNYDIDV